jgi:beta-N-acetylhexosaminidase
MYPETTSDTFPAGGDISPSSDTTIGPLMLDLEGLTLTSEEQELLAHPMVGGVIFFARNFADRAQLIALVNSVRAVDDDLLICVDQEGGRVQRFREGFTRIPPMQWLGDKLDAETGADLLHDCGWLMAAEVLSCGLDFSFAPVLDVDRSSCEVIADRSFADDPDVVSKAAGHFIAGMHEAGMAATGKHFPGHGGVRADSHLETPYDNRALDDICQRDIKPFEKLASELDAVMPAHIVFPQIDSAAVGFSSFWLQKMLREKLGFDGVIFSDDLSMKGADVAGGYADKARSALSAGCDMVLVCNDRQGALEVLDFLESEAASGRNWTSTRLAKMRRRESWDWETLEGSERRREIIQRLSSL